MNGFLNRRKANYLSKIVFEMAFTAVKFCLYHILYYVLCLIHTRSVRGETKICVILSFHVDFSLSKHNTTCKINVKNNIDSLNLEGGRRGGSDEKLVVFSHQYFEFANSKKHACI